MSFMRGGTSFMHAEMRLMHGEKKFVRAAKRSTRCGMRFGAVANCLCADATRLLRAQTRPCAVRRALCMT
jgi:hypothetical protein